MTKSLFYICCFLFSIKMNATNAFTYLHSDCSNKESTSIGKVFNDNIQLFPFLDSKQIIGFAISGTLTKKSVDYYARILLCDKKGNEHLVLELYEEINHKDVLLLSDYCEETMVLDNIQPTSIKIMLRGAVLSIDHITCLTPINGYLLKEGDYQKEWKSRRKDQVEQIVERINSYNYKNKKLWGADVTEISMLPWNKRNQLLGIAEDSINGRGFEYYARGIFEFERIHNNARSNTLNRPSQSWWGAESFDWRKRHGKNWMTSVKNQYPGQGCWAFATVGVTEAIVRLYYNLGLPLLDLSEQEVISCSGCGTNAAGGIAADAFQWIADNGISEEDAFPFANADVSCNKNPEYQQLWSFDDAIEVPIGQNKEDSIKKYLIQKGPLVSGYPGSPGHSMALVGFKTIQIGDTIQINNTNNTAYILQDNDNNYIGKTYWIFKDSYGPNTTNEHAGYAYIYFADLNNMITPYYAKTPVYSNTMTDQNIVCEDADGDGYYFWGIGQKPANCPNWIPNTPDGDDSNIDLGQMDPLGNITNLYPSGKTIKASETYNINMSLSERIGIVNNGVLTITSTINMSEGGKIRVCEGGILIIDGGTLQYADITMIPGSTLIMRNNGRINLAPGINFDVPKGVIINIESGEIN